MIVMIIANYVGGRSVIEFWSALDISLEPLVQSPGFTWRGYRIKGS